MSDKNDIPIDPDLQKMLDEIEEEPEISEEEIEIKSPPPPDSPSAEVNSGNVDDILQSFNITKHNIEQAFINDRIKIQEYLDMIVTHGKNGEFKNAHFEAVASLMATKAMTTANRVKLLDSLAKIVQATKNLEGIKTKELDLNDLKDVLDADDGNEP